MNSSLSRQKLQQKPQGQLGRWWHPQGEGRFQCELCPRHCILKPGQRGFCYTRVAREDGIWLESYGWTSGIALDPIEKKPLYHFHPGSFVLSFGTVGCNLGCRFCQNWQISKPKDAPVRSGILMTPAEIVDCALKQGADGVAFTYNDPVIFAEYAIDTARLCHEKSLFTVGVTAGYIQGQARKEFFEVMDAVNIDLKSFSEDFYTHYSLAHLQPVLETLQYVVTETTCWLEITTLVIPGLPGFEEDLKTVREQCRWIKNKLGPDVPLHFSAFHPDYQLLESERTPLSLLQKCKKVAQEEGLKYVYLGNVGNVGNVFFSDD